MGAKIGDEAEFTLTEQYKPRGILFYPVTSHDFGKLNYYVNDKLVLENWDGYSATPAAGKPLDLGVHEPDGNVIRIKLKVVGKNDESKNTYFGMDCIQLK